MELDFAISHRREVFTIHTLRFKKVSSTVGKIYVFFNNIFIQILYHIG